MYHATVLSIAGSDSGGGAGIQADLAAFSCLGVYGTTAITAVTAQNPHGVTGVYPIDPVGVTAQIDAVFADFAVRSVKTGMLFNAAICRAVADSLARHAPEHVVVDPVMVASSGSRLLQDDAVTALCADLLPCSTLMTPNLPEAAILVGRPLGGVDAAIAAALELATRFGGWVLVKGGHAGGDVAQDCLSDGTDVWLFSCRREGSATTHGTGCSLSAAVGAGLAVGLDMVAAIVQAKAYVLGRLRRSIALGPDVWGNAPPDHLPLAEIHVQRVPL